MKLDGTHALITGGSHGVGVGLAREFAARGARVTVLGRDVPRLTAMATEIGGDHVQCDLADPAEVGDAIDRVERGRGPVDVLVNNAALHVFDSAEQAGHGAAAVLMTVNVVAPIELCRQVVPGMLQRGQGHIVNVSSLAGVSAIRDLAIYGATKAALHHYTSTLRRELATTPVGVTLATLAEVAGTRMMEESRQSPYIAAVSRRLGRYMPTITPADVGRLIAEAVEEAKPSLTIPRRLAPIIAIRDLPSTLQDFALIGLRS